MTNFYKRHLGGRGMLGCVCVHRFIQDFEFSEGGGGGGGKSIVRC